MNSLLLPRRLESTMVTRLRAVGHRRAALRQSQIATGSPGASRSPGPKREEVTDKAVTPVEPAPVTQPVASTEGASVTFQRPRGGAAILRFPGRGPNLTQEAQPDRRREWAAACAPFSTMAAWLPKVFGPRLRQAAGVLVLVASGAVFLVPPLIAFSTTGRVSEEITPLVAAHTAIWIRDSQGTPLGVLPQDGELASVTGIRSSQINADVIRALRFLETRNEYFGVAPQHLIRALGCATWYGFWYGGAEARENCPGGSSLLMQASTQLRGGKAGRGTVERKWTELRDALPLSVSLPQGYLSEDQFIADNLPFGTAGGRTIVGVETASLILFGRSSTEISLAQAVMLAAMPKRQLALYCTQPTAERLDELRNRWGQIRGRALHALEGAFANDPRLADARAEVQTMPARIRPAALPSSLTTGMTPEVACAAALDPVRRTELTDSSIRTILSREVQALRRPGGLPITEIQLATTVAGQQTFKEDVEAALRNIEASQRERWTRSLLPGDGSADVLAFTVNGNGTLTNYYASSGRGLAGERRRLGSLSKLAALLAFAASGRGADSILCNRAWNGLRNADGDDGHEDCGDPRAQVTVETAFARSMNLPILEELRRIDPAIVARAARDAGFTDHSGDLPYAIAFGIAEATPLRVEATAAAMSRGIQGEPAISRVPRAIARYRVNDQWLEPPTERVDLRSYFVSDRARRLIAVAGGAPLRRSDGTLHAIALTGVREGELAKSGTDARGDALTFIKTAVGALGGMGWFVMIGADRGAVGGAGLNIYALASDVRRHSLD